MDAIALTTGYIWYASIKGHTKQIVHILDDIEGVLEHLEILDNISFKHSHHPLVIASIAIALSALQNIYSILVIQCVFILLFRCSGFIGNPILWLSWNLAIYNRKMRRIQWTFSFGFLLSIKSFYSLVSICWTNSWFCSCSTKEN